MTGMLCDFNAGGEYERHGRVLPACDAPAVVMFVDKDHGRNYVIAATRCADNDHIELARDELPECIEYRVQRIDGGE